MTDVVQPSSPVPFTATAADLPAPVAAALAEPGPPVRCSVDAAGVRWSVSEWGDPAAPPLLVLHGVTSSSATWWRVGPALAAAGWFVVAPDLPGHGRTSRWLGHHRFLDNARDVAAFARAANVGPATPVIGHSWGAMTAASLPAAGLRPARIVLIDPPAMPIDFAVAMTSDPVERRYASLDEALPAIRAAYPSWAEGDVHAKAESLSQFDVAAVRSVLLENGDWDGGLGALADPAAAGIPVWLVRGDPAAGGLVPDEVVPRFVGRLGAERVLTIDGAPHSPHRTHPEATVLALLRALTSAG